jgi:DNA-binding transcriptional LysR family regulator
MDNTQLRHFVDVAYSGSFAAVARTHGTDPSNISRSVAQLEGELGFRLFQRTTRTLALTEAGQAYLTRIAPLVDELETAREEALELTTKPKGSLRMTTSVAFGHQVISPLITAFRSSYPEVQLEVLMTDSVVDLVAERIDLAIRLAPRIDSGFIGLQLMQTRYRVVTSPAWLKKHRAFQKPSADPRQLHDQACCVFPLAGFRSRWRFRTAGQDDAFEVSVKPAVIISNALSLLQCTLDGAGPCLLADWLVDDEIKAGRLVALFPSYEVTATEFETAAWLLYPSRSFLPLKTRAMIDFLKLKLQPSNYRSPLR